MQIERRKNIALYKISWLEVFLVMIISIGTIVEGFWSYSELKKLLIDGHKRQYQSFSAGVAAGLSNAVIAKNYDDLETLLKLSMNDGAIRAVTVIDTNGKVLANLVRSSSNTTPKNDFSTQAINIKKIDTKNSKLFLDRNIFWAPINPQIPLGWVRITVVDKDAEELVRVTRRNLFIKALFVGSIFLIGIFAFIISSRRNMRQAHKDLISRNIELLDVADLDSLTKLPNRRKLMQLLAEIKAKTIKSKTLFALCYLDLDGFKFVNDTFGHRVGDEILIQVKDRFFNALKSSDTIARLGGDEFVILLPNFANRDQLENVLNRIVEMMQAPFYIREHVIKMGVSIGVAVYGGEDVGKEALLEYADQAMYLAKKQGGNQWVFFDKSMLRQ